MQNDFFSTEMEYLKGVGPQRADMLKKELGIFTFGDLLHHFPFRYVDRTKFYKVREVNPDLPYIQIRGVLLNLVVRGEKRKKYLTAELKDETGTIRLVWFQGIKWLMDSLKINADYIVFGKASEYKGFISINHPEMELATTTSSTSIAPTTQQPVYNTTEKLKIRGIDSRAILRIQKSLRERFPASFPETLPQELIQSNHLLNRMDSFINIHFPESVENQKKAEFRLKFEELFFLQMKLLVQKLIRIEKSSGKYFASIGNFFNEFYKKHLPFPLTNAQKRVLKEIRIDCGSGKQMNRMLQGDVGSGKTVVALMSILMAIDNGYQASIMAPTEILANQHLESISSLVKEMNLNVALLTGSTKTKERKKILAALAEGTIHILIGTHALIEDTVQFQNLGFVVIDEQHRFGVEQRARLWAKNINPPHVLVMTATPIPRTLAMTLYGDLDISVLDEMPPGRKPIRTVHRTDLHRLQVWGFLKKEIELGRQIYIVYPLIQESEKIDLKNLMEGYDVMCRDFPLPKYQISIVHGKMKAADKDWEMQRFIRGETNIMVATTVIEVGVNVPNASVMVIENAERFGLSQLHQLRGRVGRGADQSYCILMSSDKMGNDARLRMRTMCDTNDGFKIAEMDLQLRGAGDIEGTQQSGQLNLKIANLARDGNILQHARTEALKILEDDAHLTKEKNSLLRKRMSEMLKENFNWGRVG